MLPKSVKIKRSLSQPGQEPGWKRAKANEGTPSLSSVATEPVGAKRQVALGPFCAFVQNSLGAIFLLCCKRGATASLLVPPATEQRLQYASRLSLKWKNAASAWLLCTGYNLSMSPPHFPGLAALEERAISVISLKQEC